MLLAAATQPIVVNVESTVEWAVILAAVLGGLLALIGTGLALRSSRKQSEALIAHDQKTRDREYWLKTMVELLQSCTHYLQHATFADRAEQKGVLETDNRAAEMVAANLLAAVDRLLDAVVPARAYPNDLLQKILGKTQDKLATGEIDDEAVKLVTDLHTMVYCLDIWPDRGADNSVID